MQYKELKEKIASVNNQTSEKLSHDLQSSVVEQRAEVHAITTQVEENLKKDIAKLGAVVQSLSDKVVASLDAPKIDLGQIVEKARIAPRNEDLNR